MTERWCCSGNAEDCRLCDTRTLPYPWICPGHPDTPDNRKHVQEPTSVNGDPRQPAYDAVFAYIRQQPHGFLPTTVVDRNAMIWRAVHAALDAMGVPATDYQRKKG